MVAKASVNLSIIALAGRIAFCATLCASDMIAIIPETVTWVKRKNYER